MNIFNVSLIKPKVIKIIKVKSILIHVYCIQYTLYIYIYTCIYTIYYLYINKLLVW